MKFHVVGTLGHLASRADHPLVGASLIVAGMPVWLDPSHLSTIYWLLVIPPAAFHFGVWANKTIPAARWLTSKVKSLWK